jgi:hypothetical protein
MNEIGPDFGLHDETERWPEMRQETSCGARKVVRQVALHDALAVKLSACLPTRRSHVRHYYSRRPLATEQPLDNGLRRARLAYGYSVYPDASIQPGRPVAAEAFADMTAISGLMATAAPQAQQRQRSR